MNNRKAHSLFGLAPVALTVLIAFSACTSKKDSEETAAVPPEVLELSVEKLAPIFGQAEAANSGLFDVSQTEGSVNILYHFYAVETQDMNKQLGEDLAPKFRSFYETYPQFDRVDFTVAVPYSGLEGWRPYCSFSLTRKVMAEIDWTSFLEADFFQAVLDLKFFE